MDTLADDRLERGDAQIVLRRGGRVVGYLDWRQGPGLIHIEHVFVETALRGGGLGARLVDEAAASARETRRRLVPICGYAAHILRSDAAYSDLLER